MDSVKELAKQIAGYIKGKKTKAYDTAAEVKRIVGNTAYVHIPGGVPETPVKLTIDAKVGDTVQVRVSNSTAWLVGNSTAPPTDDTKAKEADMNAGKAMTKAKEAETIAEEGLKEAKGTSNYFWHVDGSGAESGAHVTEVPQKEFESNPSGGNLLMQSNTIKIRRAQAVLAELDASGMDVYNNGSVCASFGATTKITSGTNRISIDSGGTGGGLQFQKYDSTIIDPDSRWSTVWNADQDGINAYGGFYVGTSNSLTLHGRNVNIQLANGTIDFDYSVQSDPGITISGYEPFKTYSYVIDNHTIGAEDGETITFPTKAESGQTPEIGKPIGIVGFNIADATSSGTRSSNIYVRGSYINSSGNGVLKIENRNSQYSSKIKMTVYVLYERFTYL